MITKKNFYLRFTKAIIKVSTKPSNQDCNRIFEIFNQDLTMKMNES